MTHAVVTFTEIHQPGLWKICKDLFTNVTVDHLIRFLGGFKQERQVENLRLVIETGETTRSGKDDVDGTHAC